MSQFFKSWSLGSHPHTVSNCCWYLGVEKSKAPAPLTDQAQLDWLRTNPWNSRIGCRPSAHFLCVWEELQPPELKCISWLCIKLLLMTRSASAAMPARPHWLAHPLIHSLIKGEREGEKERMMGVKMSCKETWCETSKGGARKIGCVRVCLWGVCVRDTDGWIRRWGDRIKWDKPEPRH